MNTQKLIVKRMIEEYPLRVAKKNLYKDKKNKSFEGWATRYNQLKDADKRKHDELFAEEAEKFLKDNTFAFLIGCLFDRGIHAWQAWRIPLKIANHKLVGKKRMTPQVFSKMNLKTIEKILKEQKIGSIFIPRSDGAMYIKNIAKIIMSDGHDGYNGKTEHIWTKPKIYEELYNNIDALPGFGPGLTNMTVKIFLFLGMIPQIKKTAKAKEKMDLKADSNVQRVFYRTGLATSISKEAATQAARDNMPSFPLLLDDGGFVVGLQYCKIKKIDCEKCPYAYKANKQRLCPRIRIKPKFKNA